MQPVTTWPFLEQDCSNPPCDTSLDIGNHADSDVGTWRRQTSVEPLVRQNMTILNKIQWSVRVVASICSLAAFSTTQQCLGPQTTFRVQSSLVMVDVIGLDPKSGLPIKDFNQEDFRLFDDKREVRISTFDAGAHSDTRPSLFGWW